MLIDKYGKNRVSHKIIKIDKIFKHISYENYLKNMCSGDYIFNLDADELPNKWLMENIKSRGRDYENNVDWNYIDSLNQMYNEYFFRYNMSPVLIINTNDIDFVNNKNDLSEILSIIRKPISGTKYYNPNKSSKI